MVITVFDMNSKKALEKQRIIPSVFMCVYVMY